MKQKILYLLGMMFIIIGISKAQTNDKGFTVSADGIQVFELSPMQRKVFRHFSIDSDGEFDKKFYAELKHKIENWIESTFNEGYEDRVSEWLPKLKSRNIKINQIPNKNAFIDLIFSQSDYGDSMGCKRNAKPVQVMVNGEQLPTITKERQMLICSVHGPSKFSVDDFKKGLPGVILGSNYHNDIQLLRKEWEPKLKSRGITNIPKSDELFADQTFLDLVFSQPDYKNKFQEKFPGRTIKVQTYTPEGMKYDDMTIPGEIDQKGSEAQYMYMSEELHKKYPTMSSFDVR